MKVDTAAVAFISTYEAFAIATGLIPTWSALVERLPVPAKVAVTAGACGWLVGHWLGDDIASWASAGAHLP